MQVQQAYDRPIKSFRVYYEDGGDGKPPVGAVVCYDLSKPKEAASADFAEQKLGVVVRKPKTANLGAPCGIITRVAQVKNTATGDYSGTYEVIPFKQNAGFRLDCLTKANMVAGTTLLECVDDEWSLALTATWSAKVVAVAMETANTSAADAEAAVSGV